MTVRHSPGFQWARTCPNVFLPAPFAAAGRVGPSTRLPIPQGPTHLFLHGCCPTALQDAAPGQPPLATDAPAVGPCPRRGGSNV